MARDFYDVLGVSRKATADEIKAAYRKLARQYHPDRNPGDKQAEARFKEVQEAYDVLSEPAKRSQYDRFGTAGPDGGFPGGGRRGGPRTQTFHWGAGEEVDPNEIFSQIFGGAGGGGAGGFGNFEEVLRGARGGRARRAPEPQEVESEVSIPFLIAARGGSVPLRVDDKQIDVKVPEGVEDGQTLRLQGAAPGGANLRLKLRIEPHPYFRREGKDIILDVPLSLAEATLGAQVDVPTLDGTRLTVKIPPGTSSGGRLRLRGKGIAGGDQYIEAKVMVPAVKDGRGKELVEELAKLHPQDPRSGLKW
jgi:DnaJ-class molecular chaperone